MEKQSAHENELQTVLGEHNILASAFNEQHTLHELKHYLPAQAPLKDFIHHNTLHAFQTLKFENALTQAATIFGYKVSLTLNEYRDLFNAKKIKLNVLEKIIAERNPNSNINWLQNCTNKLYDVTITPRIGKLRGSWKERYAIDLDAKIQPILFRILCSYLDQGISIWNFPTTENGFLSSIKELEKNTFSSLFKTDKARNLLLTNNCELTNLLKIVVGNEAYYEQYVFDQQFSHQGWSGIVSSIEDLPSGLLDTKKISTKELIQFELLLEIDALATKFGNDFLPLCTKVIDAPTNLFTKVPQTELAEVMAIWQEAYEWSYYDDVLAALKTKSTQAQKAATTSFQAMFCIDDRECSLRRYLEKLDTNCETYGTPGFFNVEFFFKPQNGKFLTKLCPAPVTPNYLIKEQNSTTKLQKEAHLSKYSHSLLRGWLISQTLGFWAALKLFYNVFKPTMSPATASSFKHMDKFSTLTIENKNITDTENGLQVGFTVTEMTDRVENLLKSIGLIKNFSSLVYVVGHGSSSVNNPHYSAYDCGACSGRPGSVNARVWCFMANHLDVRNELEKRGLIIPASTQFVGGLHDTCRDEITFYDEKELTAVNKLAHQQNELVFINALDNNAKERSRRLESIDTTLSAVEAHEKIKNRSVSLFEPRPELNHATNSLCIVGKRSLSKQVFLDRRAFMNSYDYSIDLDGKILSNIMKPLGPVCGGINLEYYFSRVDNQKLGAGTKLPHNVMGLFGVANGIDGDLRPGLPSQMIEVHDPVRLLIIVEHYPEIVLKTIKSLDAMYEWYNNEWIHLVAINPETKELYRFKNGKFDNYNPLTTAIATINNVDALIELHTENIPVYLINN